MISGALFSVLLGLSAVAYDGKPQPLTAAEKPKEFEGIGITERLGEQVDLNTIVQNEKGESLPLKSYFNGHQPVILSLVYYSCPGLCNFHLNGVVDTLKAMDWNVGEKFQMIALSFDSKEKSELAQTKKKSYLEIYGRPGTDSGWHFLTADENAIKTVTENVGFKFRWNETQKEWAHASAAIMLTPDGKISRYLHGIAFDAKDFKLALGEASSGKIGSIAEKLIWYCFKYDPQQSKYTLYAFRLVQLGGGIFILILGALLLPNWLRARKGNV